MKTNKTQNVKKLIKGIDKILSKNRGSFTIEEEHLLEEARSKLNQLQLEARSDWKKYWLQPLIAILLKLFMPDSDKISETAKQLWEDLQKTLEE